MDQLQRLDRHFRARCAELGTDPFHRRRLLKLPAPYFVLRAVLEDDVQLLAFHAPLTRLSLLVVGSPMRCVASYPMR